ncbi:MAG: FAD-binding oxidoreductase [Myxococcales bacterium]|nr:FAD-binding oxidoreductase [Myxococcales bacterium]
MGVHADREVLVVGGGVVGLTTALELLDAGYSVQVAARELLTDTTSAVAAAFWYPYAAYPEGQVTGWAQVSLRRYLVLADDPATGVLRREALEIFPQVRSEPGWASVAEQFHPLVAAELPPGYADGFRFTTTVVETGVYLPWLQAQVQARGGRIVRRELRSLDEVREAPIAVICAGLGARALVPDASVYPIRGQVVRVQNPGLTRVWIDEHSGPEITYIVPRSRDVVLGGSMDAHADDRTPDPARTREIVARCARLEPRLADAPIVSVAVGLRPARPAVRLESETLGETRVIYNYGHGGAGVTLSWGCAAAVRALLSTP